MEPSRQKFEYLAGGNQAPTPDPSKLAQHQLRLVPILATGNLETSYGGYELLAANGKITAAPSIGIFESPILGVSGFSRFGAALWRFLSAPGERHFFQELRTCIEKRQEGLFLSGVSRSRSSVLVSTVGGHEFDLDLEVAKHEWDQLQSAGIQYALDRQIPRLLEKAEADAQSFFHKTSQSELLPRAAFNPSPHEFCPVQVQQTCCQRGASLGGGFFVEFMLRKGSDILLLDEAGAQRMGIPAAIMGRMAAANAEHWNQLLPKELPTIQSPVWSFEGSCGIASTLFVSVLLNSARFERGDLAFAHPSRDQLVIAHVGSPKFELIQRQVERAYEFAARPRSPHFYQLNEGRFEELE